MAGIVDIAKTIDMNVNTLRYWLRSNSMLYIDGVYPFNLYDLFELRIKKGKCKKNNNLGKNREYKYLYIADSQIETFIEELNKFLDFHKKNKKSRSAWTQTAIECYDNFCVCGCKRICPNYDICRRIGQNEHQKFPIQDKVKELLDEYGEPTDFDRNGIVPFAVQIF